MRKSDRVEYEKKINTLWIVIIILLIFLGAAITAQVTPPAPIIERKIIRPESNFCNYVSAHIKLSGDNYRIEYRILQDGATQYTEYTKSLDQLTLDARSIYNSEQIDIDQYHCLLAGRDQGPRTQIQMIPFYFLIPSQSSSNIHQTHLYRTNKITTFVGRNLKGSIVVKITIPECFKDCEPEIKQISDETLLKVREHLSRSVS
jgi:hypothetical protein